ncbi:MAG TPA: HlyD family secretion protein [Stellaceae bacterium]|nr:HlyD family secretion protein [Stellaceae bacterium]
MPRDNGHTLVAGRSRARRRLLRPILLALGPVALLCVAGYLYLSSGRYVSTDDSYVRFNKVQISSDVAGRIVTVAVNENDRVTKDQLLFALDDEPYRIALMRAEATLAAARNDVDAMRAAYRQKAANLKAAQVSADYLQHEAERQRRLAQQSVASESKLEDTQRSAEVARQQVSAMQQELAQALANLGGSLDLPVDQQPRVEQALAARDQAALDLRHTHILAPSDGIVANIDPRPGQYVTVGQAMCSLVEAGSLYIEANLKETELTHVKPGDEATVTVDTFPGRVWHARVTSLGAGTGTEFSILPAQNATGNWVKIQQRVPVRLYIRRDEDVSALRAGLSVTVEIDTRHATALGELFGGS